MRVIEGKSQIEWSETREGEFVVIMSQNHGEHANEEAQQQGVPILQMQALMGEMRWMMRAELEQIHVRLDRVEDRAQRGHPQVAPNAQRKNKLHRGVELFLEDIPHGLPPRLVFEPGGFEDKSFPRGGE